MERYIALLRGVNISGKNKISMSELKCALQELAFSNVVTYLNSGNIIFSSNLTDKQLLSQQIALLIKQKFNLTIPVFIVRQDKLNAIIKQAPNWWGTTDKEVYDNLIFIFPPATADELCTLIGQPNLQYEQIVCYLDNIFWSFNRKDYQRSNWWKQTARKKTRNKITIRTANTIKKIITL